MKHVTSIGLVGDYVLDYLLREVNCLVAVASNWTDISYFTVSKKVRLLYYSERYCSAVNNTKQREKATFPNTLHSFFLCYLQAALNDMKWVSHCSHIALTPPFWDMLWCSFMALTLSSAGHDNTVNGSLAGSVFPPINHSSSPDRPPVLLVHFHTLWWCQHHYPLKQWPPLVR